MRFDVYATALLFTFCLPLVGYSDGFNLKPGEVLKSIDGKPVGAVVQPGGVQCQNGQCQLAPAIVAPNAVTPHRAAKMMRREIRRDARAYAWAMQEAKLCAANGYRNGHPRGSGGWSSVGTGYSHSADRPVHCLSEYPTSTYRARACYHDVRSGRFYWVVVR